MLGIDFEWDERKNKANYGKHGVWFEEAKTAFHDPYARLKHDLDRSDEEDRFVLLGMSDKLRLIVVCHVYRKQDAVIRIYSARRAVKDEAKQYGRYLI